MKIDATRNTFKPGKNYSRVLMQQGRVQLDADWNEQSAIQTATTRRLAADLIGPHGGPPAGISNKAANFQGGTNLKLPPLVPAFAVNVLATNAAQAKADFLLLPGHYYVDGVLCSNATTPSIVTAYPSATSLRVFAWTTDGIPFAIGQYLWLFSSDVAAGLANVLVQVTGADYPSRTLTVSGDISAFTAAASDGDPQRHFVRRAPTYLTQPDMPGAPALKDGSYQVYLDVWERAITAIEDDAIREAALNGPDTAARAKVVAQVKLTAPSPNGGCFTSYELSELFQPSNRGCLMARARPSRGSADPCTVSPDARYYGPENQLYRVEVHTGSFDSQGNAATPTFKWSRENGAVVFAIAGGGDTSLVTLESLGRDDRFGLVEGDWVEVVDDDYILQNRAAPLRQVTAIDRVRMTVTLGGTKDATVGGDPARHPHLRRWDQKAGDPGQGGLTLSATDNAALIPQANAASGRPATFNAADTRRLGLARQNTLWLDLEDGVQVQFVVPSDSTQPAPQFRTGDYWLIPARVATGDVEWPTETVPNPGAGQAATAPVPMPPDGVAHHYAPLALVNISGTNVEIQDDCGVVFWQDGGVLRFLQDGGPYSVALAQEIETAPTQASQPEMAVAQTKPAAVAAKRLAKAAPVAKAIQAAKAAQPAAAAAAPAPATSSATDSGTK